MLVKMISVIIICFASTSIFSQSEGCKVLLNEISGKYTGKCKNGLAHGKGIAIGMDTYEGKFKNGLPHGHGKYVWSSGQVYLGSFKNGKKSGSGTMQFKYFGKDSTFKGVWADDTLSRIVLPPKYEIIRAANITRHSVQRVGNGSRALFAFQRNGGTNPNISNLQLISNYGNQIKVGVYHGFENIKFPFNCKVSYITPNQLNATRYEVIFEITINEPGDWVITINN